MKNFNWTAWRAYLITFHISAAKRGHQIRWPEIFSGSYQSFYTLHLKILKHKQFYVAILIEARNDWKLKLIGEHTIASIVTISWMIKRCYYHLKTQRLVIYIYLKSTITMETWLPLWGHSFPCNILASGICLIIFNRFFQDLLHGSINRASALVFTVLFDDHSLFLITRLKNQNEKFELGGKLYNFVKFDEWNWNNSTLISPSNLNRHEIRTPITVSFTTYLSVTNFHSLIARIIRIFGRLSGTYGNSHLRTSITLSEKQEQFQVVRSLQAFQALVVIPDVHVHCICAPESSLPEILQ